MKAVDGSAQEEADEISTLIATLHRTGQRLEDLTGGQVDAVSDSEGRSFMLRHAQDKLRFSDAAKQAAILNALPAHIALLDARGQIALVNEAWRQFADANEMHDPLHGMGADYLDVCDRAEGEGSAEAHAAAAGIRSVLNGDQGNFSIEYPCHAPKQERWFLLMAAALADDGMGGAVVMHLDITERRRAGQALRKSDEYFRFLNQLSEATRTLVDPERLMATMSEILGKHMQVSRCAYAAVDPDGDRFTIPYDYTDGCASVVGTYKLSDFGTRAAAILSAGQTLVIRDVDAELPAVDGADVFNAIGIKAIITCPLAKNGALTALMAVHQTVPRNWTPGEVALVQEIVERCWANIERIKAEADLNASELRFRQVAENINDVFYLRDADGARMLYVSPAYEAIWGRSCKSLYENPASWSDSIHPDDREAAYEKNRQGVLAGLYEFEYRIVRPDGAIRWIETKGFPVRDEAGKVSRIAGLASDVTLRKKSEEDLLRFSAAMDVTADAIYLVDRTSMSFVHVNETACRMQDQTREAILAQGPAELLGTPREELERVYDAVIASGIDAPPVEMLRTRADGSQVWVELRRHPLRLNDRWMITTLVRDVTDRKKAAQELRDSESRFRSLTELSSDWFWEQDAEYRFVKFSGGDRLKGWGPDQDKAIGVTRWNLPGIEPLSESWDEHKARLDAHKPFRDFEYRRPQESGEMQYVAASGEPVLDTGGRFTGYRGVATDITARKLSENRIKRLNRVYAMLSGINTLIVHARNREVLFTEACRIAVEAGDFKMAWIGTLDPVTLDGKVVATHGGSGSYPELAGIISARSGTPESWRPSSRAMRELCPVICNDIASDPGPNPLRDAVVARGHKSGACFPLTIGGRAAGVLALFAGETDIFDEEETRLLAELAGDISFALEHLDKAEKLARMTRVNAMLSDVNAAIVRIRDRQALFEEACRIAVETGGFAYTWLSVVDEAEMRLRPVASSGVDEGFLEMITPRLSLRDDAPLGHGIGAKSVREGRAIAVNDVPLSEHHFKEAHATRGIKSAAAFPIFVSGRVIGSFALHAREAGFFDEDEMKLLKEMAGNIAFALEHIDKEERVRRLTRVYAVLSGINTLIVHVRDREELFREACRIAVESGGFRMSLISMVDRNAEQIVPVASAGKDAELLSLIRGALSSSAEAPTTMVGRAIREKRAILSNDSQYDPQLRFGNKYAEAGVRSLAVLPLIASDEAIGVFVLYSETAGFFDDDEMKLLTELAGDIAFAIDHIGKEAKIARLSRIRSVMSAINAVIVRVRDRRELYAEACRIAIEHGGFAMSWIGSFDPATEDVTPVAWAGEAAGELTTAKSSARADTSRGTGAVGQSIRERRPVFNNHILTRSFGGPRLQEILRLGFQSQITLPLYEHQAIVATLTMYTRERGYFDDEEVGLLSELAGNISFAIENIGKQQKLDQLARIRKVSSEINALIVRASERDELFKEACRIAVQSGGFKLAWVGIVEPGATHVKVVASEGAWQGYGEGIALSLREGDPDFALSGGTVRDNTATLVEDMQSDPRILRHDAATQHGFRSLTMLPLSHSGGVVGVLALYAGERSFFDDSEMALLRELAGDLSFALDHLEKQKKLDYLAYYDVLTGLANRSLFHERVGQYMRSAVAGGHKLALFFFDLERFRNINDSLGRSAGDAILKQIAAWLLANVGEPPLLARVGADHFAIVLPQVKGEGHISHLLEKRIRAFHEHPFQLGATELRLSIKVGVALFPNDGTSADMLLQHAEAALKRAKASGDQFLFYTQKMSASVVGNLTLESKLRQALEKEEFVLHYQPKLNLDTGRVVGAEALIRWNDPATGLVPPGHFIPILEETGLIYDVGRWALRKAVEEYLRWRKAGLAAVRVAVNVSPLQLRNRTFIDDIEKAIGIHPEAPAGLELEITESLIMEDVAHNIASLQAIRAMGVSVAIDDFGTGYSSLSYLSKLPVDTLKIDRSFVVDMTASPQGLTLVSTIVTLAHSLKLKVVAEGVETDEQQRLLRLLKCDEMQGFLFSKPVPGEVFEKKFLAAAPAA